MNERTDPHCKNCGKRTHIVTPDGYAIALSRFAMISIVADEALTFCSLDCLDAWQGK